MIQNVWTDITSLEMPDALVFERLFQQHAHKIALVMALACIMALALIH